jgi:hypothetical protein
MAKMSGRGADSEISASSLTYYYGMYVNQSQAAINLCGEYMKTVRSPDQWDAQAINAVSALPLEIGFLTPNTQQLNAYRLAFENFQAGANFMVADTTAAVQVATETHDRLEHDIQLAGILTAGSGLVISAAELATKEGSTAAAQFIVTKVVTGGIGVAVTAQVSQSCVQLAQLCGANPDTIRIGADLVQFFQLLKLSRDIRTAQTLANPEPQWQKNLKAGRAFDDSQSKNYDYNQVYVNKGSGTGYFKLDSYNPATDEIVSRKFTQLADINIKTALWDVNEIPQKYAPGTTIANVQSNITNGLAGLKLEGQMILEVPVQTSPIPQVVLDAATQAKVTIRDINGKVYN